MGRYALLVGVSNYTVDLKPLPSAAKDVEALRQVLVNPEIGGFAELDVAVLVDAEKGAIESAIYDLFANRKTDDLLLLYFSGHGVTDSRNDFYFTGTKTRKDALPPTAVSSTYVHSLMNQSRSKRQVVILDCCHSGAFPTGMTAKDIGMANLLPKLGGEGRAILTASDSTQYAFEQEGFELSLYTHFLVEGLRTGAADRDDDGHVSVDELYEYVRDKVKSANNNMSPEFYPVKEGHRIVLARAAQDDPKLKFRKEITKIISFRNGKIFPATRQLIINAKLKYKIVETDALEIEQEILKPFIEYDNNLKAYESLIKETIKHEFPFSEITQLEIENCEIDFGLRPNDIKEVKERIFEPRQTEHDRLFEDQQKKVAEAARLNRQQEESEQLRLQQVAAAERQKQEQDRLSLLEQLKRQAEEEERRKRQREEAERKSKPVQPEFEFEILKVRLVKESSGFLGLGTKTKVELERKKGKAQYIRENLANGVTLVLVRIPTGKFMMGSNEYSTEQPIHEATLKEFWMGKYTVTNAQWQAIMGTKPSKQYDSQPVVGVSWDDAKEFCKKASEKTGKSIRLPSETEWEYACRAGTTTPFHFGETITPDLVNYDGNAPYGDAPKGEYRQKTVNVESFSPNAWGLYQMHGNVWEWCEDIWHENYNGIPQDGSAWLDGGEQGQRLLRGGSFKYYAFSCRSAHRRRWHADDGVVIKAGFRVVASVLS
ncbi:SUMF1/EgtB/PvdO family nonheme iron enzyme [Pseudanabaena sp. UWO311]|uniref:caspase, EACC1-associated type n=1 Tax=Pseudanabaena sp. UWO311 TaxID=2487337 RepID=UPI0011590118|nr:SUMF1/EgtB/PvdO family nonheme iron enzyme [Pseudanabaena sp. UWO311]TYQ26293.1 SUMF1/EgtB/PvdO family nonheme iron enzyme [Pseudanabaena sp. UWO311]